MPFPDPCGQRLANAIAQGGDARTVVPDEFVLVRGGSTLVPSPGEAFSGAVGPTLEAAAAAVPHGQIRVSRVGAVRQNNGVVEFAPELSRHGTLNNQPVNVTELGPTTFSELQPNPVPRGQRIDGQP